MTHQDIDTAVQQLTEEIQARDTTIEALQTELHNVQTEFQEYQDHIQSAFEIMSKQAASGSQITKTAGRIFPQGTTGVQGESAGGGVPGIQVAPSGEPVGVGQRINKDPESHQTNMAPA